MADFTLRYARYTHETLEVLNAILSSGMRTLIVNSSRKHILHILLFNVCGLVR